MPEEIYLSFTDNHGVPIRIVRDEDTLWIRFDAPNHYPNASPHLRAPECQAVIKALYSFLQSIGHQGAQKPLQVPGETQRGFNTFGGFDDLEGEPVRLQESSQVGAPCCWAHSGKPNGGQIVAAPEPHLDGDMAWKLIEGLGAFIQEVTDDDNWRNSPEYIEAWGAD